VERPKAAASPRAKPGEIRLVRARAAAPERRVACYARVVPAGGAEGLLGRDKVRGKRENLRAARPIDIYPFLDPHTVSRHSVRVALLNVHSLMSRHPLSTERNEGSFVGDHHHRHSVIITAGTLPC